MLKFRHHKKNRFQISLLTLLLLFICSFLYLNPLFAHEGEDHSNLFIGSPGASDVELPEYALSNMARIVTVDPYALSKGKITIRLFNDRTVIAKKKRSSSVNDNSLSWIGEVAGYPGSLVVITDHNGVIAGSVSFGSELYQINPAPNGSQVFFRVDEEGLPAFGPPIDGELENNGDTTGGTGSTESTVPTANSGFVVDLMVVYTPASKNKYGGQSGVEATIISAVEAANQAYQSSLIDMSLNIVNMAEVNYAETGDMGVTLAALRSTSDGIMDEVHGWRDLFGADMVAMISEDTNYCGIAYVMTSESTSFASSAFSVTLSGCLSNQTLAHELGHNNGNMHDRANSSFAGAYPYSYGFRRCETDGTGFRTIMSYSCSGGTRINYFSNPDVFYNGFATGIDHDIDPVNSADAARSMNNTADTMAAFRPSANPNPPAAPTNLATNTVSYNQIDVNWMDNSSDENGFRLEQSLDQTIWTEIATLSANITSYSDNSLSGNTTSYYRVRAYNGAGNSAYSNIGSATTLNPSPPPTAPSNLVASPVSGSQIDLAWSEVNDEIGYRIERSEDELAWSTIATVGQNAMGYSDTNNLQVSTTYFYHVIAFNDSGDSSPSNTASATTGSTINYFATGETTVSGQLTGDYISTQIDDGIVQMISEVESGGKPSRRYSYLEHIWHFNVNPGLSVSLYANVYKTGTTEDNFKFQYSMDGQNFIDMGEVVSSLPDNLEVWQLPTTIVGLVDVKVIDSDQTRGNRSLESINIDQMYIQIEADLNGTAPIAPGTLTAETDSSSQVSLTWTDNSSDESGFQVERSDDNKNSWIILGNVTTDATGYIDDTVVPETSYFYRVNAYNGSGSSAYIESNEVTTPAGIVLTVTGYKVKGLQHADLSWNGATEVAIYRDGVFIANVAGNVFTDNIASKGSGTYMYHICDDDGGVCSDSVEIVF